MKRLLFFFFIFLSASLFAQDWTLFPLNQKSYYTKSTISENLEIVMSDSVIEYGDRQKILFTGKGLNPNSGECYDEVLQGFNEGYLYCNEVDNYNLLPYLDSIVYKNDTAYIFSDSITYNLFFLPNCGLGQSWNILPAGYDSIFIKCISIEEENVFGTMDTVRSFIFEYITGTTSLESLTIKLSKSFGLLSFISFNTLSIFEEGIIPKLFILTGYEKNEIQEGFFLPDYEEYFPYTVGDILTWEHNWKNEDIMYYYNYYEYFRDSILSKEVFSDSIVFNINRTKKDTAGIISSYETKSVFLKSEFNLLLKSPPYYITIADNKFGTLYEDGYFDIWCEAVFDISATTLDTLIYRRLWSGANFLDTVGCTAFNVIDGETGGFYIDTKQGILYTNRGSWYHSNNITLMGSIINGVELGVTSITNIRALSDVGVIYISPNPSSSLIHLNLPSNKNYNYKIYNFSNQLISTGVLNNNEIEISNLQEGIYFLEMQNENEILRGKFVKM